MQIALVGCGYVADFYCRTLKKYPRLAVAGAFDRKPDREEKFCAFYGVHPYRSLDALLADERVEIVLNLTNPRSHYEVTRACLLAGKHVYSEKPLTTNLQHARELVELAARRKLQLACAPCSVLGDTAQALWRALREERIGRVRLVYAEMDDGMIHLENYRNWRSPSGAPWPAQDEFETGCTLEHAGYVLGWLTTFFGSAKRVTAFASCLIEDKLTDAPLHPNAPDFSVGCIELQDGVIARLTNSIVAPRDHGMRIIGDRGELVVRNCWDYHAPVFLRRSTRFGKLVYPLRPARWQSLRWGFRVNHRMDFARGVTELAEAITEGRPCRLSAQSALHVTEICLSLQECAALGTPRTIESSVAPIAPTAWAA